MAEKTDNKKTIVLFYCSVRPGRQNDRVGKLVKNIAEANGLQAIVFDPANMPFEILKTPLHFMRNLEEAPEWLKEANTTIKNASGYIIITSEYNCGVPPALANMLDHFPPASYRHRPCGLVSYSMGNYGGIRASTLLRPLCSELGMITIPAYVAIPTVDAQIDDEGNTSEQINKNITKLVTELAWYAKALDAYKASVLPPS